MNLTGQGSRRQPGAGRSRLDDRGYIMVVLLIGIAVAAVWMGSMLPSWRQQAVREKEADLIFRGEQYARAIALYWRKNQSLPPSIDILVSQHYLRQKYKDPITDGDFLPVGGGFGQSQDGSRSGGGAGGQTPGPASGGRGVGPTLPNQVGRGGAAVQLTPQAQLSPQLGGGGISGVRSTSNETSIRIYRGQQTYSQFPFDYTMALQKMGMAAGSPLQPGRGGAGREGFAPVREGQQVSPEGPGRGQLGGRGLNRGAPPPPPPPPAPGFGGRGRQ